MKVFAAIHSPVEDQLPLAKSDADWDEVTQTSVAAASRTAPECFAAARAVILEGRVIALTLRACVDGAFDAIVAVLRALALGHATGSTIPADTARASGSAVATRAAASAITCRATTATRATVVSTPDQWHQPERADA